MNKGEIVKDDYGSHYFKISFDGYIYQFKVDCITNTNRRWLCEVLTNQYNNLYNRTITKIETEIKTNIHKALML